MAFPLRLKSYALKLVRIVDNKTAEISAHTL